MATLPMDDVTFTAELVSHHLLPGDRHDQVKSKATRAEKATHFLDSVIRPTTPSDVISFNELLNVMENSDYCNVKELARQIRSKLKEGHVSTDNTVS